MKKDGFEIWSFGFVSDFDIRISDLRGGWTLEMVIEAIVYAR